MHWFVIKSPKPAQAFKKELREWKKSKVKVVSLYSFFRASLLVRSFAVQLACQLANLFSFTS